MKRARDIRDQLLGLMERCEVDLVSNPGDIGGWGGEGEGYWSATCCDRVVGWPGYAAAPAGWNSCCCRCRRRLLASSTPGHHRFLRSTCVSAPPQGPLPPADPRVSEAACVLEEVASLPQHAHTPCPIPAALPSHSLPPCIPLPSTLMSCRRDPQVGLQRILLPHSQPAEERQLPHCQEPAGEGGHPCPLPPACCLRGGSRVWLQLTLTQSEVTGRCSLFVISPPRPLTLHAWRRLSTSTPAAACRRSCPGG